MEISLLATALFGLKRREAESAEMQWGYVEWINFLNEMADESEAANYG